MQDSPIMREHASKPLALSLTGNIAGSQSRLPREDLSGL
jgi:hypothetical protein